jgi:hypothetical protein
MNCCSSYILGILLNKMKFDLGFVTIVEIFGFNGGVG